MLCVSGWGAGKSYGRPGGILAYGRQYSTGRAVADMSTGGHDGVLVGNGVSVPGILGEGLAFDGVGGKASIAERGTPLRIRVG